MRDVVTIDDWRVKESVHKKWSKRCSGYRPGSHYVIRSTTVEQPTATGKQAPRHVQRGLTIRGRSLASQVEHRKVSITASGIRHPRCDGAHRRAASCARRFC